MKTSDIEGWEYAWQGWSAHTFGAGPRHWWLARYENGLEVEVLEGRDGRLIYFMQDGAQKRCDKLNTELFSRGEE